METVCIDEFVTYLEDIFITGKYEKHDKRRE